MTQSARVGAVECEQCGLIEMALNEELLMDEAEKHRDHNPNHEMRMHVFESTLSRKL